MSIPCLFEDRFTVRNVDNIKIERVSRIRAKSSGLDAELILDVHNQLLPVTEKQVHRPSPSGSFWSHAYSGNRDHKVRLLLPWALLVKDERWAVEEQVAATQCT